MVLRGSVLGVMLSLSLAAGPVLAWSDAELATVKALQAKALAGSGAYEMTASLTTEIGARMAGSEADKRAVQWAVAQLKAQKFDKVWTEPVRFPLWTRGHESVEILAPFAHKLALTALGHSEPTPAGGLTGEVVRYASLEALVADNSGAAKGKIVFIDKKMERFKDGAGYGKVVRARSQGANVAAEKGAKAVLIRSIGTDSDRLPHTGAMRYAEHVHNKIPAAALSNPDADLLARVMSYGKATTLKLTLDVKNGPEVTSHNVIAEIRGSEKPDEIILLGAHLDSWDLGTGAIDDGAGVAVVATAARMIGELKKRPKRTIRVVLFANEENGLYGAKAYAAQHKDAMVKHVVGVESDFGAGLIYRFSSGVPASLLPSMQAIAEQLKPLGILPGDNTATGGPDLQPLREAGMAVAELEQDGTDYFDYHHTANDTLDKIEPKNLDQNVAAYATFAYLLAQVP